MNQQSVGAGITHCSWHEFLISKRILNH